MTQIPRDTSFDSTLSLLSDGYRFISKRCQRHGSDIFETRIMLRTAFCTFGEEAARMFYQPDRFTRKAATPPTTLKLLQDRGSVQTLDGNAHRQRKKMFMSLMSPTSIQALAQIFADEWRSRIAGWGKQQYVVLHDEAEDMLCRAACHWAGIRLTDVHASQRARAFAAMIDGAGAIGPRNWRGMLLRSRTEQWARNLIITARSSSLAVPEGSATQVIAMHAEPDGKLLDVKVAAVELINVLRPTVAVAYFITFAAHALHHYPACRQKLASGDEAYLEMFVQEVRRFYPFFPLVAGKVLNEFEWHDHRFTAGTWVFLDMYGTNHDPRSWDQPDDFQPERFRQWNKSAYNFIPQGGGDHRQDHRCAGERITIELMKTAVRMLVSAMTYEVPEQDLQIDMSRMPALPTSRFVMTNVRKVA